MTSCADALEDEQTEERLFEKRPPFWMFYSGCSTFWMFYMYSTLVDAFRYYFKAPAQLTAASQS